MITLLDAIGPAVWRASWQAGLLAALVTLALWILGERITPRWRFLMWSVVLVRFLFVVTPASPWSVFNVAAFETAASGLEVPVPHAPESLVRESSRQSGISDQVGSRSQPLEVNREMPAVSSQAERTAVAEWSVDPAPARPAVTGVSVMPTGAVSSLPVAGTIAMTRVLLLCWLGGCVFCVGRLLSAAVRLRQRLRVCREVTDARILELLQTAYREFGIRRTQPLLVTPEPVSPCLVGTWRPRIVVPESLITDGASLPLRQVLAHELAHVARGDQWTNWLLIAAGTLHWFNPMVWWTLREMRAQREAACDDIALDGCQVADRTTYAATILGFVSGRTPSPIAPGMIGLFSSQQSVARRMQRVLDAPAVTPLRPGIAAGLALVLGLVGLTDAMPPDVASQPLEHTPMQSAAPSTAISAVDLEPDPGDYVIRGECIDSEDLTPMAGVRLRLFAVHGLVEPPVQIAETVTGDDGQYEFTGLTRPRRDMGLNLLEYGVVAHAEGRPTEVRMEIFRQLHPRDELVVTMRGETASLTGRVVNQQGQPVVGATVTDYFISGRPVPGVHMAVTDEDGQFVINGLAAVLPDPERPDRVHFRVMHPDHPVTSAAAPMLPADVEVILPDGCMVVGQVLDGASGQPEAGLIVAAENNREVSEDRVGVTDAEGRFRLVVAEGDYNILVKSEDRVAVAITDQDCQADKTLELPPLELTPGGFIAGRVVNADTGEPVIASDSGDRITIGLYGPAHPPREGVTDPRPLVAVDDRGRFTLRAAAGENFPYLVNIRGTRMAWDTRRQEPVVVTGGETVNTEILIEPPRSPAEKMQAARRILAGLPDETSERVAGIIEEFRKLNHTVDETEVWCLLMRDLVGIGSEAVPQLCAELDRTTEQRMLRRLGFALRAIGDPRAVPALVRAVPRTLLPSSSDYGLLVDDAELTRFMQTHDLRDGNGRYFNFGRPVREVFGALHELTGQDLEDAALFSISLSEDPRRQVLQRRLYVRQAQRWQEWWETNWRDFTGNAEYAVVNLMDDDEPLPPASASPGPDARVQGVTSGMVLSPASESGRYLRHFVDLDTGYQPTWPNEIPQFEDSVGGRELAAWAEDNGIDLMCVTHEGPDGLATYVLRGFDLEVHEISERDLRNLDRLVGDGTLPEGRPVGELLLHYDAESQTDLAANGAFLYVTREGNRGVIEVTDRVTRVADLTGLAGSAPPGTGFHKGVRFNLTTIVP